MCGPRLSLRSSVVVLAVLCATLLSSLLQSTFARAAMGTRTVVRFEQEGLLRAYVLYVPSTLVHSPGYQAPLLLVLHGLTQTPTAAERDTEFDAVAERNRVVVAYPAAYRDSWNAGTCCGKAAAENLDDVAFLDNVIARIEAARAINTRRVYLAGFSNGGMMAYRYACERAGSVAAVAVASASLVTRTCRPARPISVAHFHGSADEAVPFGGTGNSRTLHSPLRSAPSSTGYFARRDGCSATTKATRLNAHATRVEFVGCPAGIFVRVYRSSTLAHSWTRDASGYGFDETLAIWRFLSPQHR